MRALKIAGIAFGALVVLLLVVSLAVHLFVNPNDYKGRIAAAVKASTGRELQLPGDIKLSVFPWVALELGPASLGNPPGFDSQPFVSVRRADLRVKLLPLLRKQLRIGKLAIEGLDLRLVKNAKGVGNWQDFGSKEQQPPPAAGGGSGAESLQDLAGVSVKDSRISYQDTVVENLNLEIGHVAAGVTTPVELKARLLGAKGGAATDVDGRFELTPNFTASHYEVTKVDLAAARAAQGSSPALKVSFTAPQIVADLKAQTLTAAAFTAVAGGAHIGGSLQGTKIVDAPNFAGSFKLEPCPPRELMSALGVAAPKTRDPKALSRLAAAGQFAYGGKSAEFSALQVQLDDTTLKGSAGITDLETEALGFDLALDHIDFDRYRPPAEPAAAAPTPAKATAPEGTPQGLKTLLLKGKLSAGEIGVAGLKLTQLAMTLEAKDGITHLAPASAALYGGTFNGDVTLDARGSVPLLKINQTLNGVDVAQLLHDLANKPSRISGRGHVSTNLTARGAAAPTIMRSLTGHVAADLDNGAVEGVDLWFEINRAVALIQKQSLSGGSSSGRTRFDTFKATADLVDGVATTKDLSIISQNLRLAGQGTLDIVSEAVNYQITATVLKQPTSGAITAANTVAVIPANVTGTLTQPKVLPDLQALAKARLQQELGNRKGQLQQQLQDKLQGLFK